MTSTFRATVGAAELQDVKRNEVFDDLCSVLMCRLEASRKQGNELRLEQAVLACYGRPNEVEILQGALDAMKGQPLSAELAGHLLDLRDILYCTSPLRRCAQPGQPPLCTRPPGSWRRLAPFVGSRLSAWSARLARMNS